MSNDAILDWVEDIGGDYVWEDELCAVKMMGVAIGDDDVDKLCDLEGVQQLAINGSRLSWTSVRLIATIPGLVSLVLTGRDLTEEQIQELNALGPNVEIADD